MERSGKSSQKARDAAKQISKWAKQRMCLARLLEERKIKDVNEAKQFLSKTTNPREIDRVEKHGLTPLMLACHSADEDLVAYLLEKGADTNKACFKKRNSALHYACNQGDRDGSLRYCDDKLYITPEDLLKRTNIVRWLLNHGATLTLNADDMNPLHTAAVHGLKDIVDVFVASDSGVDVSLAEKIKAFQLLGVSQVVYESDVKGHIVKARGFFTKAAGLSLEESVEECPLDAQDLQSCFCNGEYMQKGESLEEDRATWIRGYTLGKSILPDKFKRESFWCQLIKLGGNALYEFGWGVETGLQLLRFLIGLEVRGQVKPGSVLENMSQFFTENMPDTPKPIVTKYLSLLLETYADGLATVRGDVLRKYGGNITEHLGNMLAELAYYHARVRHLQSLVAASERIIITINESIEVSRQAASHQVVGYRFSATSAFVMNLYLGFWDTFKLGHNRRTKENVLFVLARLLRCDKASSRVLSYQALHGFLGYSYLAVQDMDYFYTLVQLMVRYGTSLGNKDQINDCLPKELFLRSVQRTGLEPDAPPFKRLYDLLTPGSSLLTLEELAAGVIMSHRIPYRGKLPTGLADIFEERYLGGKLTRIETDDDIEEFSENSGSEHSGSDSHSEMDD